MSVAVEGESPTAGAATTQEGGPPSYASTSAGSLMGNAAAAIGRELTSLVSRLKRNKS